ncbi:hypothetical protein [Archangium sp.]|jgi:hypothetical protein|uniref:hypothetical protein n=1 Tax=Archangium sp. TaxID=1872627 RepID=UPI002ED88AA1
MSQVFKLQSLREFGDDQLDAAMNSVPEYEDLRDAVGQVIRAIHGLPEAVDRELRQIEIYLGRAGYDPNLIRNRWRYRYDVLGKPPSAMALPIFSASTARMRNESWERKSHLIIQSLSKRNALCCSNAAVGDNGPWPSTRKSVVYLVAKLRPGMPGERSRQGLNEAIVELHANDELEDDVVREAGRLIPDQTNAIGHELIFPTHSKTDEEGDEDETSVLCKSPDCTHVAKPRNYGYCRVHRCVAAVDEDECKSEGCRRPAKEANYGYCGYHRRVGSIEAPMCKQLGCRFKAQEGNYGYCGRHR